MAKKEELRGTIKVIHGRHGKVRIEEDLGDEINVYTAEEWKKVTEERLEKEGKKVSKKLPEQPTVEKTEKKEDLGSTTPTKPEEAKEGTAPKVVKKATSKKATAKKTTKKSK